MKLDFSHDGYENLFRNALEQGINLFCGAGFSEKHPTAWAQNSLLEKSSLQN